MFWVYVLRSLKDGNFYTGHTEDIISRIDYHNSGKVLSTKNRAPFELVYKEEFATRSQARWRERELKTASKKKWLRSVINNNTPL